MNLVREIKQYQATDGTCFGTRVEAEEYEEMLQNPHFKKLQERIEKLEADLSALRTEVSTKSWFRDVQINRPPYQQPMSYMAYNTATEQPEKKGLSDDNKRMCKVSIPNKKKQMFVVWITPVQYRKYTLL